MAVFWGPGLSGDQEVGSGTYNVPSTRCVVMRTALLPIGPGGRVAGEGALGRVSRLRRAALRSPCLAK